MNLPSSDDGVIPFQSMTKNIALIGDLSEELTTSVISQMLLFQSLIENDENEEAKIRLFISTYGGSVDEMMSIFDCMRMLQKSGIIIETIGLGKVMSAGVLLLAGGSKGYRSAGENCTIMIHNVESESAGMIDQIETNLKQIKRLQKQYIIQLSNLSKFSRKNLETIFQTKTDYFFNAKEAKTKGLIDKII